MTFIRKLTELNLAAGIIVRCIIFVLQREHPKNSIAIQKEVLHRRLAVCWQTWEMQS